MSKRWNLSHSSGLLLSGVVAASFGFAVQAVAQSNPVCATLTITGHPSYPPVAWAADGQIVGANGKPVRRLTDLTAELEQIGVGKQVELELQRTGLNARVAIEIADITPRE